MYINICVIVNQPINIKEQERQCMMFSTIVQDKYLNGLSFQLYFLYNRYEKMTKLTRVTIRIVKNNNLRLITMKGICN